MKKNKPLILSLIKDDLINTKLVSALDALGLDAGNYYLYLNLTIFNLMGIRKNKDELFDKYHKMCDEVIQGNIFKNSNYLDNQAKEIYAKLLLESDTKKKE